MSRCRTSAVSGAKMPLVSSLPSGRSPREYFGSSMRIRETGASYLGVLPSELLEEIFKQYVRIERARYLQQIGAPQGEYSIRDYIQEHGKPGASFNAIDLGGKNLTSLDGLALIDNPDKIIYLSLGKNYISNYYDPYLDPYVYYVVHDMQGWIEPFRRFTNLESLNLSFNKFTILSAKVFGGLPKLSYLFLYNNQLTTLPVGIFGELQNLLTLLLHGNQLTTLSEGVFEGLQHLVELNLEDNRLRTLPEGVFKGLQSLATIYLANNQLNGTKREFRILHSTLSPEVSIYWNPQYPPVKMQQLRFLRNSHFPMCPSQAYWSRLRI